MSFCYTNASVRVYDGIQFMEYCTLLHFTLVELFICSNLQQWLPWKWTVCLCLLWNDFYQNWPIDMDAMWDEMSKMAFNQRWINDYMTLSLGWVYENKHCLGTFFHELHWIAKCGFIMCIYMRLRVLWL